MLRRAGAMTLLVYATRTAAALLLGAPLGADFADALARNFYRPRPSADDSALLLELGARRLPEMLSWSVGYALAYAAIAPLLSIAWSNAMNDSSPLRANLRRGLRRYPAALAFSGCALLACAALLGGAAAALSLALARISLSASGEDAVRTGCALVTAGALLVVSCAHDLANSTLAVSSLPARRALALALRAVSARAIIARGSSALAVAACFACAELVGRGAPFALAPAAVLALQQALVFGATLLRGAWLALALDTVNARLRAGTQAHADLSPPLS
jgi:hypothetical protein